MWVIFGCCVSLFTIANASCVATVEPAANNSSTPQTSESHRKVASASAVTAELPVHCNFQHLTGDPGDRLERGMKFGLTMESRLEYMMVAGLTSLPQAIMLRNHVRFEMQATTSNGLIWIALGKASTTFKIDYAAVFIQNGFLVYKVDLGSGPGTLYSSRAVNDGRWHKVEFARSDQHLRLTVDELETRVATPGRLKSLNVMMPVYVGGMNASDVRLSQLNLSIGSASYANFVGCITGLQFYDGSKWRSYGSAYVNIGVQHCVQTQDEMTLISEDDGSYVLHLNVTGVPDVVNTNENGSILTCADYVSGFPPPTFQWTTPTQVNSSDEGDLKMPYFVVRRHQTGSFICLARNKCTGETVTISFILTDVAPQKIFPSFEVIIGILAGSVIFAAVTIGIGVFIFCKPLEKQKVRSRQFMSKESGPTSHETLNNNFNQPSADLSSAILVELAETNSLQNEYAAISFNQECPDALYSLLEKV